MRLPDRSALSLVLAMLLVGCATTPAILVLPAVTPEMIKEEAFLQQESVLLRLQQQDQQLSTVAYRLGEAGTEICPVSGPVSGLVLHHQAQYGAAIRPYAARVYRMGDEIAIMAVAAGSPADVAGLKPGDRLVMVNGLSLPTTPQSVPVGGSYAPVARARRLLEQEILQGPLALSILRDGVSIETLLVPVRHCTTEVQLEVSDLVEAAADSERVFISTGMVRYARSDEELAVFVAHELAHIYLQHQDRLEAAGKTNPLTHRSPESLRRLEAEADHLGLYLTARAGYDAGVAPDLWRRLGIDFPFVRRSSWSHPGSLERIAAMRRTLLEIQTKKSAGLPIRPDRPVATAPSEQPNRQPP